MKSIRQGIVWKYTISYLAVVLTACLALGVSLTLASTSRLQQMELEIYQDRLHNAANFVRDQIDTMNTLCTRVKASRTFQPFYVHQSVINDLEVIEALANFRNYSSWLDEFYLWYPADHKIYAPGCTYDEDVFTQHVLGNMTVYEVQTILDGNENGLLMDVLPSRPDSLFVAIPFTFRASRATNSPGALLFFVKDSRIRKDVLGMTGTALNTAFELFYGGKVIFDRDLSGEILSGVDSEGEVTVRIATSSFTSFDRIRTFRRMMICIMSGVGLVGVVLAVFAAWRSSMPIRDLYRKYVHPSQRRTDELQSIEIQLQNAAENISLSRRQMDEQLKRLNQQQSWLRQQMVQLLILGNSSSAIEDQIHHLGCKLDYNFFSVIFLHLDAKAAQDNLIDDIEALSDSTCSLYVAEMQPRQTYTVLVNFDSEDQYQDILKLLADLFTSRSLSVQAQLSRVCDTLSDIAPVAIEALGSRSVCIPAEDEAVDSDVNNDEVLESLMQIMSTAQSGSVQQALVLLDLFIVRVKNRYPSNIMRYYMLNIFCQRINAILVKEGILLSMDSGEDDNVSMENMIQFMRRAVIVLNAQSVQPDEMSADISSGKVAAYIRQNCLNYDISLTSIANDLGISTRQVTRLVRAEVNMTFKEYILQLRMEAAKRILSTEDVSIGDTAERVGYFNISHFIKSFKDYVGLTPGEYRRMSNGD